jgi:hypothetical protein
MDQKNAEGERMRSDRTTVLRAAYVMDSARRTDLKRRTMHR